MELTLKEENCNEYEFDAFSLVHNLTDNNWELHFYDEAEGELFIYVENNSFDEEEELFNKLGFTKEIFDRILSFEESKNEEN